MEEQRLSFVVLDDLPHRLCHLTALLLQHLDREVGRPRLIVLSPDLACEQGRFTLVFNDVTVGSLYPVLQVQVQSLPDSGSLHLSGFLFGSGLGGE